MQNKVKTKIINLYGGPGVGKSTSAAYLFYLFKIAGKNAELVREYVKSWAYEERTISTYDQIYFLGKQSRYESFLFGKVEYLITDCPLFMNYLYARKYCTHLLAEGVKSAALAYYQQSLEDGHQQYHILLNRDKPYSDVGRYQTESQAIEIDTELKTMMQDLKLPIIHSSSNEQNLKEICNLILGALDTK